MNNLGRLLLVDDEPDLLEILGDFLTDKGFTVVLAPDGAAALDILNRDSSFDLLLSDINMPRMKGFELLARARALYPGLKSALITAYDINHYIDLAKEHDVGNIIAKTSPFNFNDFLSCVTAWISGDVFGLGRQFKAGTRVDRVTLEHSRQIEPVIQKLFTERIHHPRADRVKTALREIVVNAVYYGARHEDGAKKDEWILDVDLGADERVYIDYAEDDEKFGIAVIDQKGRLKKSDVLYWLERNISRDPKTGLIKSLDDEHGRGLFITREFIDSLIINIERGRRTEILLMSYFEGKYKGFKPLLINEV